MLETILWTYPRLCCQVFRPSMRFSAMLYDSAGRESFSFKDVFQNI